MALVNAAPGMWRRIAARRLQLGLTQEEVETAARIARTTLSRLEREDCPLVPRESTVRRIANALAVPYERLVNADAELDRYDIPEAGAKIAVHRNGADHRRGRRTPVNPVASVKTVPAAAHTAKPGARSTQTTTRRRRRP